MNYRSKRTRASSEINMNSDNISVNSGDVYENLNVGIKNNTVDAPADRGINKSKGNDRACNSFSNSVRKPPKPTLNISKSCNLSNPEKITVQLPCSSNSLKVAPKFGPFKPSEAFLKATQPTNPTIANNPCKNTTTFIPSLTSQASKDALKISLSKTAQMTNNIIQTTSQMQSLSKKGERVAVLQDKFQLDGNEEEMSSPNRNNLGKFKPSGTDRGNTEPIRNRGESLSNMNRGPKIQQSGKEGSACQPYTDGEVGDLVRQRKESDQQVVDATHIGSFSRFCSEELEDKLESEDDVDENLVRMEKEIPLRPRTKKRIYRPAIKITWSEEISSHDPDEEVEIEEVVQDQGIRRGTMNGTILASHVWLLPFERKLVVPFNEYNQPIRKGGVVLVHFLSDLAKNGDYCPIGETSWRKVDKHFKLEIISLVRQKFVIPHDPQINKIILGYVNKAWKQYRHDLKSAYYKPNLSKEQMISGERPIGVISEQWIKLVSYWCSEKAKKLSKIGSEARASQLHAHTTGSRSMAQWKIEFEKIHKRKPRSNLEFWKFTHATTDGGYIENTDTQELMDYAEAEVSKRVANSKGESLPEIEDQVFHDLMYSNNNSSHVVGYGFGVTKNQVFGLEGELNKRYGSNNLSNEIQGLKAHLVSSEKTHIDTVSRLEKKNEELEKRNDLLVKQNEEILSFLNLIVKKLDDSNAG